MPPHRNEDDPIEERIQEPRRHRWPWFVYLILYAVAIPWYWPAGYRGPLVLGFPLWTVITLAGVLLLAGWTCWVIFHYWKTGEEEDSHGEQ